MVDYESQFEKPAYAERATSCMAAVFRQVYGWMCGGLLLSGVVAWYTASSGLWQKVLTGPGLWICIVAELVCVFTLSSAIRKLSAAVACALFVGYAALNGLTLSVVFIAYKIALVEKVFFLTAGMFGGFALYGMLTRSDLSKIGSICGMALWGLVLAAVVNLFFGATRFDWIVSIVGIVVFCGLTMWDAQKVRLMARTATDSAEIRKYAILGALALYLDFINLFLYLLRFMGGRNRN